jgi:hypothetical protein
MFINTDCVTVMQMGAVHKNGTFSFDTLRNDNAQCTFSSLLWIQSITFFQVAAPLVCDGVNKGSRSQATASQFAAESSIHKLTGHLHEICDCLMRL